MLDPEGSSPALCRQEASEELPHQPVFKSPLVAVRNNGRSARQRRVWAWEHGHGDSAGGRVGSGQGAFPPEGEQAFCAERSPPKPRPAPRRPAAEGPDNRGVIVGTGDQHTEFQGAI